MALYLRRIGRRGQSSKTFRILNSHHKNLFCNKYKPSFCFSQILEHFFPVCYAGTQRKYNLYLGLPCLPAFNIPCAKLSAATEFKSSRSFLRVRFSVYPVNPVVSSPILFLVRPSRLSRSSRSSRPSSESQITQIIGFHRFF